MAGNTEKVPIAICGAGVRSTALFKESTVSLGDNLNQTKVGAGQHATKEFADLHILFDVVQECLEDACEIAFADEDAFVGIFLGNSGAEGQNDLESDLGIAESLGRHLGLQGPAVSIGSGPSAAFIALHEACYAIASGMANSAVAACIGLSSNTTVGQGEFAAVYVKPLDAALRDGNPVRALIRAIETDYYSSAHEDEVSPELAYDSLIRRAYYKAGLNPIDTTTVQTTGHMHPTISEAERLSINKVFDAELININSIKLQSGSEQNATGMANLLNAVFWVEDRGSSSSRYPLSKDQNGRVSINCFDARGSNVHIIIDLPPVAHQEPQGLDDPQLMLFSGPSSRSLTRQIKLYENYCLTHSNRAVDIAYTRAIRRKALDHRAFSILSQGRFISISSHVKLPSCPPQLTLVFTGQGAQWAGMGVELIETYPKIKEDLEMMDKILGRLVQPPSWSILGEITRSPTDPQNRVNSAELAPTLCTALQIALLRQFERLEIQVESAIGHSSGEIAAAHAAGYLSLGDAIAVAYHYGKVATGRTPSGGMATVSLGADACRAFLREGVVVGCENSPGSSTLSGELEALEKVLAAIQDARPDVSVRMVKIEMAYHSDQMRDLVGEFLKGMLEDNIKSSRSENGQKVAYYSSTYGRGLDENEDLGPEYWVKNLTQPVLFSSAVACLIQKLSGNPFLLEVGPHSTLAVPLRQICDAKHAGFNYASSQTRGKDNVAQFLTSLGRLWQEGASLNLHSVFPGGKSIGGLPVDPRDDDGISDEHVEDVSSSPNFSILGSTALSAKEKRELIMSNSLESSYSLPEEEVPTTEIEVILRVIWAKVLQGLTTIHPKMIGKSHNFFFLGGDSLVIIEMVKVAYEIGLRLAPAEVVQHPRLSDMASIATIDYGDKRLVSEPFSMLPAAVKGTSSIIDEARQACSLSDQQCIEDMYPCTALQEGFMALAVTQPGSYVHRWVYKLSESVEVARFQAAWDLVIQRCTTLRSRICSIDDKALQVVVQDDTSWEQPPASLDVHAYVNHARSIRMAYGDRLSRYALVHQDDGAVYFVWILHHAAFDGLTMKLVLDGLYSAYHDTQSLGLTLPYANFIEYVESLDVESAKDYWRAELEGAKPALFPTTRPTTNSKMSGRVKKLTMPFHNETRPTFTTATILRAAWAVVLAKYCDTNDVCFGTTVSGRQAPVPGLGDIPGPMIATIPVRVRLMEDQKISSFLQDIQTQATDMIPFEQLGLQNIAKLSQDAREACNFSNLFVIQPLHHLSSAALEASDAILYQGKEEMSLSEEAMNNYFTYPLVIQPRIGKGYIEIDFTYYADIVPEKQLDAVYHHLKHVIDQLLVPEDRPLRDISVSGSWDIAYSRETNIGDTRIVDDCFHHLVERQAKLRSAEPAIDAWDLKLTYGELNDAANRLSRYLVNSLGVKSNDLVHVCFEKSGWYYVAILAVNKAGAAWVPLDPSHPVQRLQQVVSQTQAKLALSSSETKSLCSLLLDNVLEVGHGLIKDLEGKESNEDGVVDVSPEQAAYVLFTSGSTGIPKGFVMEHKALCTSQTEGSTRLGMTSETRMLQFAAYVFDFSIGEIVAPLIVGGCLCVPSEHDRTNRLAKFVSQKAANWMYSTPAFLRTLTPQDIPSMELIMLGGESVGQDILDTWFGKVRLLNAWGPGETCVFNTFHEWASTKDSPRCIGRPMAANIWIVDPKDPQKLAPIGTSGEVLIQGPTLLREYLANRTQTESTIIRTLPTWATHQGLPGWGRMYKTGDLCSYDFNGTMEFISRKDTQVKIRGMRVELEEIENHIRAQLPGVHQVVVDVLKSNASAVLVAYLCFSDERRTGNIVPEEIFHPSSSEDQIRIAALLGQLGSKLPRYMIPTHILHCRFMPSTSSTKLDRRKLGQLTATLTSDMLNAYSRLSSEKRAPETEMEARLHSIWADVLQLPPECIGRDDSFLRIGGDSISVIKLISVCRQNGIVLSTKDVFDSPTLLSVAAKAVKSNENVLNQGNDLKYSLLSQKIARQLKNQKMIERLGLSSEQVIEDAFPCSPMQQGLMALTAKQPGSYVCKYVYRIPEFTDIEKMKYAWDKAIQLCTNFRSRIVLIDGQTIQLVIKERTLWEYSSAPDPETYIRQKDYTDFGYGASLSRYTILSCGGDKYFVWTAHHALYDGWSLRVMTDIFEKIYTGQAVADLTPYSNFIKYIVDLDSDKCKEYWAVKLAGSKKMAFPPLPYNPAAAKERSPQYFRHDIELRGNKHPSITSATIIRAAWAVVLASYCNSDDICFGVTVSGRQAPVPGIENMSGPGIATVPVRFRLDGTSSVAQFLQKTQEDAVETIPFEQFGLQKISRASDDARVAVDFSTLLVIQPTIKNSDKESGGHSVLIAGSTEQEMVQETLGDYFNYPLVLVSNVYEDHFYQRLFYDGNIISEDQVVAMSNHLEHVIQQLLVKVEEPLKDVSLVGQWDIQHAINSQRLCAPVQSCTHWLIQDQIKSYPDDPAVAAWDQNLTYSGLGVYASRLALKLQELGVGPETLVPFCFPKSAWAVVTMVAIQMAGGAFVPLDPAAPVARLQSIIDGTNAKLVIASPELESKLHGLHTKTLIVDETFLKDLPDAGQPVSSSTKPTNASFVIFTSGSTGKPKGILIQHDQICTGFMNSYGHELNLGRHTRVFNFCAFTFDLGIFDVIGTLSRGGCVCMPSEEARLNDLAGAIRAFKANWLFCTPTVLNLLRPEDVPLIKTVGLGGEAITKTISDRWKDHVQLNGLYGPAEGSSCARNPDVGRDDKPTNIGVPMSSAFWVVNPENMRELVPVGGIGELLIQGPMLARGYINVSLEQNAVWIEEIDWLPGEASSRRGYLTGDLVRRNADGTCEYLGRKDTQVKIHGQRVELGEIEAQVHQYLPNEMSAIVDIVKSGETPTESLTVMMWYNESSNELAQGPFSLLEDVTEGVRSLISSLNESLQLALPSYMIPSTYLVFQGKPDMSTSGKVDRKILLSHAASVSAHDRLRFELEVHEITPPTTDMEFKLRDLWAQILAIEASEIGKYDSFLRLGGDSISAIQLVTLAREHNIGLSVALIFSEPQLSSMAEAAKHDFENSKLDTTPFRMISEAQKSHILAICHDDHKLESSAIEDAYPSTKLQEGLMALSVKQPGSYIATHMYRLPDDVDIEHLQHAIERTVELCSNLRTRIIDADGEAFQVVVKNDFSWEVLPQATEPQQLMTASINVSMTYGSQLNHFTVYHNAEGTKYLMWRSHHTTFDGWTIGIILDCIGSIYYAKRMPNIVPYSAFVSYTLDLDVAAAEAFWAKQLQGAHKTPFPSPQLKASGETKMFTKFVTLPTSNGTSITQATIIRAAWAILLARYSGTDHVCYGAAVSGRSAAIQGVVDISGVMVATVPVYISIDGSKPVGQFLEEIQRQASDMIAYEQFGLQNIAAINDETKEACDLSSLVAVQTSKQSGIFSGNDLLTPMGLKDDIVESSLQGYLTYTLVMEGTLVDGGIELVFIHDTGALKPTQIDAMAHQLEKLILELRTDSSKLLKDVSMTSNWDVEVALARNPLPQAIDTCVQYIFEDKARTHPDVPAVYSWDGQLSYGELNTLANNLASYLMDQLSVNVGDIIHVCFDKSAWYCVAILAILKAGASFSPIDPAHPTKRKEEITKQTKAKLMLVSSSHLPISQELVEDVLPIDEQFLLSLEPKIENPQTTVSPDNIAYIMFTSGSTGKPKGYVTEHRALASGQQDLAKRLRVGSEVRILQFGNFIFDFSIGEIWQAWEFMNMAQVNGALFTPTFASTIKPQEVPSLKWLLIGGETMQRDVFESWFGKVRLIGAWGPGESCVISSAHEYTSLEDSPSTIGDPIAAYNWIVDPEDPRVLAPVGTVGEILVQGPTVFREYLGDPEKTKACRVENVPPWAFERDRISFNRSYRSGDLAFYNAQGKMEFVSRKDTQVKIRGLRVELSEIEHHIVSLLGEAEQVAVDVYRPEGAVHLVAYFAFSDETKFVRAEDALASDMFLPVVPELEHKILELVGKLKTILPGYMVPSIFIPCGYMPMGGTSKLDRKALQGSLSSLTQDQLAHYSLVNSAKRAPQTPMESRMQELWATLLKISSESIGIDDSFLQIGGDSIRAIQLVAKARGIGLGLTVKDIFDDPRLHAVASCTIELGSTHKQSDEYIRPFSLLPQGLRGVDWESEARDSCGLAANQYIENAMPVTTFQEGLMALSVKQPGSHIGKFLFKLAPDVDVSRFRNAWGRTVCLCRNLRTRIVNASQRTLQLIVANDGSWEDTAKISLKDYMMQSFNMSYGSRLNRWALFEESNGETFFSLTAHHAIYDGWSVQLVLQTLAESYNQTNDHGVKPFDAFIKYTESLDANAARQFWLKELKDASAASFPPRRQNFENAETRVMNHEFKLPISSHASITQATIIRAAWALLLAQYCGTESVCFGTSVSGRQAPVSGIGELAGPAVTTMPVHIPIDPDTSTLEFLRVVQAQATEMIAYEQFGLHNILKLGDSIREACTFSSLLVVQPREKMAETSHDAEKILVSVVNDEINDPNIQGYFNYPLIVQAFVSSSEVHLNITYYSQDISTFQVEGLLSQLEHVIKTLSVEGSKPIRQLEMASPWDLQHAQRFNDEIPEVIDSTFHELVEKQAKIRPDSIAVQAWDATLTYSELNMYADYMARYLIVELGVERGDLIHVCFEKSAFHLISILAINKAGAGWVPLDPSHPFQRLQQLVSQTKAKLILTSCKQAELSNSLLLKTLQVTRTFVDKLAQEYENTGPVANLLDNKAEPSDVCYVLFTSGSTGTPKGLVMEHRALCTSQSATVRRLGFNPKVRMLQFASYVFDMSVGEIVGALISGATLCVPSDDVRLGGVADFIREKNVTWAYFTPSFVRTLTPESIPSLELLALAGEAIPRDVFEKWVTIVRLINGWGPAETCVFSTLHEFKSIDEPPQTLGRPVGGLSWVVQPDDPYKLAPIGTLGEVVVQGPTLLREYLADPERTEKSTVQDVPQWNRRANPWSRGFRTGDLCFINGSGLLEFASRKDTQVKVRGARVELGEVENAIQSHLPGLRRVAVDIVHTPAGATLSAFLCFTDDSSIVKLPTSDRFLPMSKDVGDQVAEMLAKLKVALPLYMVPRLFIPCSYMPFITSSKLDRKTLISEASSLDHDQIVAYSLQKAEKRPPITDMEFRLQKLWAEVLHICTDSIGRDDSFFAIGGDSIAAIHLMTASRKGGLTIRADDVFRHPQLFQLALRTSEVTDSGSISPDIEPFELLTTTERDLVLGGARSELGLGKEDSVEDAFPCSPLQEGLIYLSVKQAGSYIAKYFLEIPDHIDVERFKIAWKQTVELNGNLRTRIIDTGIRPIQILLKEDLCWEPTHGLSLETFVNITQGYTMTFGTPLNRYAIVSDAPSDKTFFVWISHHSISDGWALQLAFRTLFECYWEKGPSQLYPYANFIKHTLDLNWDAAAGFWSKQLEGATSMPFPPPSLKNTKPVFKFAHHKVQMPARLGTSATLATVLRAAWAIVLARHCNTSDVCFGATVSGRNASLAGLQDMPGPTIATIPVRIRLDNCTHVESLLQAVQNQATEVTAYEQFGIQNISKISNDARNACQFSSLLVIRPQSQVQGNSEHDSVLKFVEGHEMTEKESVNYFTYPLIFGLDLFPDHIGWEFVVEQIFTQPSQTVSKISLTSPWDIEHALRHQNMHASIDMCIHDMIREQIALRPDSRALVSWDGEMSYKEVGYFSEKLATKLRHLGVEPRVFVPVCFPKSIWAVISMIAINMAGGAFVPLDFKSPASRLKEIISDTKSKLVLADPTCLDLVSQLGIDFVIVNKDFILESSGALEIEPSSIPLVKPTDPSIVLFTSGSTGKPKGIVFEHRNTCSTAKWHGDTLGWGPDTRVFTYSAYTFDMGILEILMSLSRGACLCIPSEWQRYNDIHGAINSTQANWAFFTPTLAGLLNPNEIPTVKGVGLGGEKVTQKAIDHWEGHAKIYAIYGPAETSNCNEMKEIGTPPRPNNIGGPSVGAWWAVNPDNYKELVPVGCIGELMIQGPMMSRGYISASKVANKAWLYDVDWLPGSGFPRKAYLTGDLVRRLEDGTFYYLGRKDTQIKLHGQRVELSEIETRVEQKLPPDMSCVVDCIINEETGTDTLVVLLWYTSGQISQDPDFKLIDKIPTKIHDLIAGFDSSLSAELPVYMVPGMYLVFQGTPERNRSGKVDRRKLREIANAAPASQRLKFSSSAQSTEKPETELEITLSQLWAQVLPIDANDIGRHESFLRAGGDSISAIRLSTLAREQRLSLDVATIFRDPRLSAMASAAAPIVDEVNGAPAAFSLISDLPPSETITEVASKSGFHDSNRVEDILPCTPLQSGLMALTIKQPRSYIAQNAFQLSSTVNIAAFKNAWARTAEICPTLRTRIVQVQSKTIQAVFKDDFTWEDLPDNANIPAHLDSVTMSYGDRLNRFFLYKDEAGIFNFVWLAHHTVFDGWTVQLIMRVFNHVYHNVEVPTLTPYSTFIAYTMTISGSANKAFWEEELRGAQMAPFPPASKGLSSTTEVLQKTLSFPELKNKSVTSATILRAAWALLLARYCGSDDITFAATVSGRNAPVAGIDQIPGTMIATIPVRIKLDNQKTVHNFLEDVQSQAFGMAAYEQYGLQNIAKVSADAKEACEFSSLTVIQPSQQYEYQKNETILLPAPSDQNAIQSSLAGYFTYPLVMQCLLAGDEVDLCLIYDAGVLKRPQIEAISHQFEKLVSELLSDDRGKRLENVSMVSSWDVETAISRNPIPQVIEVPIPNAIANFAKSQPEAPAVHAWDGDFTYSELDDAANRLAGVLARQYHVGVGDVVHVCMGKSKWYPVSILAINKARAAFSPVDPEYPFERKQNIVQQTGSRLALISPDQSECFSKLGRETVHVTDDFFSGLKGSADGPQIEIKPEDVAYVLFTSGSTGTPKGFIMEHGSLSSAQHGISERIRFKPGDRVLQFANFAFDFSIGELFQALYSGACICIPSDEMRLNNIQKFIRDAEVDCALVSPAFARTIRPEQVPSLKTLGLGGETVPQDLLDEWHGRVRLINFWGPGETCFASSIHEYKSSDEAPATIGYPVGSRCWIVDPTNPRELAPIGTVGEVLIQGPTIIREYLNDAEKTRASIVEDLPLWAMQNEGSRFKRAFLSGDLASYNPDGTMHFVSRKDTQVKIRGLRVELGEIEHHILSDLVGVSQVAVDVLRGAEATSIVAYFSFSGTRRTGTSDLESMFQTISPDLKLQLLELLGKLRLHLPAYMVPSIFIPCNFLPISTSSKLNRKALQEQTAKLSIEQLHHYSLTNTEKRAPETPMETRIQALWASILGLSVESIGRDDNFLQLGGDSITAIHLVAAAREVGIELTVIQIFEDPRLSTVASRAIEILPNEDEEEERELEPFDLVPKDLQDLDWDMEVGDVCDLEGSQLIENAMPATSTQEYIMRLSAENPEPFISRRIYKLSEDVNIKRFRNAWVKTVGSCPILRTRIVEVSGTTMQVVVAFDVAWEVTKNMDLEDYISQGDDMEMSYGSRLNRWALIQQPSGESLFVLTSHQAIHDEWTIRLILRTLSHHYDRSKVPSVRDFGYFIQYLGTQDHEAARKYWQNRLQGVKAVTFPSSSQGLSKRVGKTARSVDLPKSYKASVSPSTLTRASWALLLAYYCGTDDVCFGTSFNGRQALALDIRNITGPVSDILPFRVRLDRSTSVGTFLELVQKQAAETTRYQHFGLADILKLGGDSHDAATFSSILKVESSSELANVFDESDMMSSVAETEDTPEVQESSGQPMVVEGLVSSSDIRFTMHFNSAHLSPTQAEELASQLEQAVHFMATDPSKTLGQFAASPPMTLGNSNGH
ncbi:unnamed protein product [Clonostachys rosea]|uniref:Carrier domain-containing protein n=1 Tax=Bionectria ochroleuca TaxID=29856 RepID=A0ABY6UM59_BIOOC|nr:unnamed protein product [Clonostachys rosea]